MSKIYDTFDDFQEAYEFDFADTSKLLGNGNYGQVVKGWQNDENREVAIKCSFRPEDDSVRREFEGASDLNHPNISRYLAYGRLKMPLVGLRDFTVMQYYPDGNLHNFINQHTPTPDQTRSLVRGILKGLAYLHQHKRIHRDFKPSNILITHNPFRNEYVPLLADFGSIKLLGENNHEEFSLSEHAKTISFAAPEQVLGEPTAGYNIDLWAFGVVLYQLCTKEHPFTEGLDKLDDSTARKTLTKRIATVELPNRLDKVEEPYQTMIRRCLVADRTKRIQTTTELIDLLDNVPQMLTQAQLAVAQTAFEQKDYKTALTYYEKVLTLHPDNKIAQEGLAGCKQATAQPRAEFGTDPTVPIPHQQVSEQQLANPEEVQPQAKPLRSPVVKKLTLSNLRSRFLEKILPVSGKKSEPKQKVYPLNVILRVAFLGLGFPLAFGYMIAYNFKVFGKPKEAKKTWIYAILAMFIELGSALFMPFNVTEAILIQVLLLLIPICIAYYVVNRYQTADLAIHTKIGVASNSGWRVVSISWAGLIMFSLLKTFLVVECTYIGGFSEGLARVGKFGKYGYIDKSGEMVIQPQFDRAEEFSEGLAFVQKGYDWTCIDKTGRMIFQSQFYITSRFSEGFATVLERDKNDSLKDGYIDKTGRMVIQPQFDRAEDFNDGLAYVRIDDKDGYVVKDGYIDKSGRMVIPYNSGFSERLFGPVNGFKEGLLLVEKDKTCSYIDKTGQMVIQLQLDDANDFSEGLACVRKNDEYGYIDKTGRMVIQPQFDEANDFSEGLARVRENGKYGYIDKTGRMIIQPQFDEANDFSDGLALINKGDTRGYIDKTGWIIIQSQFSLYGSFSEGLAPVERFGRYGYIDKTGRMVIINGFTILDLFLLLIY